MRYHPPDNIVTRITSSPSFNFSLSGILFPFTMETILSFSGNFQIANKLFRGKAIGSLQFMFCKILPDDADRPYLDFHE